MWQPLNEPGVGGRIDSIAVSPHRLDQALASPTLAGGDILGARLSLDGGESWNPTSGWLGYEISDFTWHSQNPEVVWAGSLSGPHLSLDSGKTWASKRQGLPQIERAKYSAPVEKILFDPDSDDILAFGGDHRQLKAEDELLNYGAVWHSDSSGESWGLRAEIVSGGNVMSVAYAGKSASEIYAAVWNHGIFYSDNDGRSWTQRNSGLPVSSSSNILASSLAVHPTNADIVWAAVENDGIYRTLDGGRSWRLLDGGIPAKGTAFWSIEVGKDGETLYAGNKNFNYQPGVYKSADGGNSWRYLFRSEAQIDSGEKPYLGGIVPWWLEIDPADDRVVYAGTDDAIYKSENGGNSWRVLTAQKTAAGWQGNGFSGLVARNIEWDLKNPQHVILQGMDGAVAVQSWDGDDRWRVDNPGLPAYSGGSDIAFSQGAIFGAFGQDDTGAPLIARSDDADNNRGQRWTTLVPPAVQNARNSAVKHVHADPDNPDRLWAVVNQQLWYSNNASQTTAPLWTQLPVGFRDNKVGDLEPVLGDDGVFYVSTDNGVYRTDDGATFSPIGGLEGADAVELAVSASPPHVLYAFQDNPTQGAYGLWRYQPSDDVWSLVWDNPAITAHIGDLAVHPTDANVLALITNDLPYHDENWATGVWISQDAGESWAQETVGLPMLRGDAIAFHPNGNQLVVGLNGAGFYTADFSL